MKEFDWNEFKKGNITIHCKTKSEANDFCRLANTRGLRWDKNEGSNFSRGIEFWEKYKEDTCYRYSNNGTGCWYGRIDCYKIYCKILEWSDYMVSNDMPELKLGMIVENKNQDIFLVLNYDVSTDTATLINSQNTISMHESFVKSDTIYKVYNIDDLDGNINELLTRKVKQVIWERKQLYNAKVVCIGSYPSYKGSNQFIKGKIYKVKDGRMIYENGLKSEKIFDSLSNVNDYFKEKQAEIPATLDVGMNAVNRTCVCNNNMFMV